MTEQLINGVVMASDRSKALTSVDYNVEVPDEDEEPGKLFFSTI
jgi:hypothetical protein